MNEERQQETERYNLQRENLYNLKRLEKQTMKLEIETTSPPEAYKLIQADINTEVHVDNSDRVWQLRRELSEKFKCHFGLICSRKKSVPFKFHNLITYINRVGGTGFFDHYNYFGKSPFFQIVSQSYYSKSNEALIEFGEKCCFDKIIRADQWGYYYPRKTNCFIYFMDLRKYAYERCSNVTVPMAAAQKAQALEKGIN